MPNHVKPTRNAARHTEPTHCLIHDLSAGSMGSEEESPRVRSKSSSGGRTSDTCRPARSPVDGWDVAALLRSTAIRCSGPHLATPSTTACRLLLAPPRVSAWPPSLPGITEHRAPPSTPGTHLHAPHDRHALEQGAHHEAHAATQGRVLHAHLHARKASAAGPMVRAGWGCARRRGRQASAPTCPGTTAADGSLCGAAPVHCAVQHGTLNGHSG